MLQKNDNRAFDILYKKLHPEIYLYCKKIIKEDIFDVAADVSTNCFLKLLIKTENNFNCIADIKAWLFCVAKNECFDYLKKQKIRKKYIKTLDTESNYNPYAQKENDLIRKQLVGLMLNKIKSTKNKKYDVINLLWLKEIPTTEVAKIMNISPSTVFSHSSLAIKQLREKMLQSLS